MQLIIIIKKCTHISLDRCGGQVVSVLAFYSDDPSSNHAEAYSFFCNIVFEKNKNKQKRGRGWSTFLKKYLYGQLANLGVQVNKHFSVIGVDKRIGLKLLQISKCLC